jgi:lipoate-protein ligase A
MAVRLLNLGSLPGVSTQTIYHAVAKNWSVGDPNTIVIAKPTTPYVSIGFHQQVDQEVDLQFCKKNNIPVFRRETGGGAVLLDHNQIFVQWIFSPKNLPARVDRRFELFIEPLISTYKFFDINAYFFPPNDVHVKSRKIVGTGAARIGNAEVVTGNIILDFDYDLMTDVFNSPDEEFKANVSDSLKKYMTTMAEEKTELPDEKEIIARYIFECEKTLGLQLEAGSLTREERVKMEFLEEKMLADSWLHDEVANESNVKLVKIHAGVYLLQSQREVQEGWIKARMRTKESRIDQIVLSSDLKFWPERRIAGFQNMLRNTTLTREIIKESIQAYYLMHLLPYDTVSPDDWTNLIIDMHQAVPGHDN